MAAGAAGIATNSRSTGKLTPDWVDSGLKNANHRNIMITATAITVAVWGANEIKDFANSVLKSEGETKVQNDSKKEKDSKSESLDINIPDEDKVPRDELDPPTKPGNAPTFKKDGKSVEIHHEGQNAKGPFKEMHPEDHRGKGNYSKNHPKGQKPLTKQERIEFNNARQKYWKKEFPNEK